MDEIELRELRYFLAVAEELNFTRAAARLGMAQPPLSAAIGKLERKLGVRLLERTSRRVTLTPAGAVLLEQGRIAVEGVGAAIERARRKGTPGRPPHRRRQARHRPRPAQEDHAGVRPGPADATGAHLVRPPRWTRRRSRGGAADVAILRAPFDQRGLDTELLLTEPRVAVLSAGHPLAGRPELRRADLAGQPMPRWAGQPDPAAAAYVPISVADQHRSADLVFVPVSDLRPSEVVAAWPVTSRSRAVAGFVRAAVEVAASQAEPTKAFA